MTAYPFGRQPATLPDDNWRDQLPAWCASQQPHCTVSNHAPFTLLKMPPLWMIRNNDKQKGGK